MVKKKKKKPKPAEGQISVILDIAHRRTPRCKWRFQKIDMGFVKEVKFMPDNTIIIYPRGFKDA